MTGSSQDCRSTCRGQGLIFVAPTVTCMLSSSVFMSLPDWLLSSNKAVADGAISFYLDHRVSVRVAKWTYGSKCAVRFNPLNAEHRARISTLITDISGYKYVPKAYSSILAKVSIEYLVNLPHPTLLHRAHEYRRTKNFGEITSRITRI